MRKVLIVAVLLLAQLAAVRPARAICGGANTLYRVCASGGTWSDAACWSCSSGGTGGDGVPDATISCVIDVNSGAGTIDASGDAFVDCLDFTETAAATATLAMPSNFRIHGSATWNAGVTITGGESGGEWGRPFDLEGAGTLTTNGDSGANVTLHATGTYTLQDNWTRPRRLGMFAGTFDTGGHNMDMGTFEAFDDTHLVLNNSTIKSHDSIIASLPPGTVDAGTSIFTLASETNSTPSTGHISIGGDPWYDLRLQPSTRETSNIDVQMAGRALHHLTIDAGTTVQLYAGGNIALETGMTCTGLTGSGIVITSDTPGTAATITTSAAIACDQVALADIDCEGTTPCDAGPHSVNLGGNTNWTFENANPTWTPTPTPTPNVACCDFMDANQDCRDTLHANLSTTTTADGECAAQAGISPVVTEQECTDAIAFLKSGAVPPCTNDTITVRWLFGSTCAGGCVPPTATPGIVSSPTPIPTLVPEQIPTLTDRQRYQIDAGPGAKWAGVARLLGELIADVNGSVRVRRIAGALAGAPLGIADGAVSVAAGVAFNADGSVNKLLMPAALPIVGGNITSAADTSALTLVVIYRTGI